VTTFGGGQSYFLHQFNSVRKKRGFVQHLPTLLKVDIC